MKQYTVTLSDDEEKALLTDMLSVQEWLSGAIHNKARRVIDTIIEKYAKGELELETQFTAEEKAQIENAKKGKLIVNPRSFSRKIKGLIVKRVKVETAKERNKRFEE